MFRVSDLERYTIEGDSPVTLFIYSSAPFQRVGLFENSILTYAVRSQRKLNIYCKPIAHKYCEGKVKRTQKRELKVPEIVKRKGNTSCVLPG